MDWLTLWSLRTRRRAGTPARRRRSRSRRWRRHPSPSPPWPARGRARSSSPPPRSPAAPPPRPRRAPRGSTPRTGTSRRRCSRAAPRRAPPRPPPPRHAAGHLAAADVVVPWGGEVEHHGPHLARRRRGRTSCRRPTASRGSAPRARGGARGEPAPAPPRVRCRRWRQWPPPTRRTAGTGPSGPEERAAEPRENVPPTRPPRAGRRRPAPRTTSASPAPVQRPDLRPPPRTPCSSRRRPNSLLYQGIRNVSSGSFLWAWAEAKCKHLRTATVEWCLRLRPTVGRSVSNGEWMQAKVVDGSLCRVERNLSTYASASIWHRIWQIGSMGDDDGYSGPWVINTQQSTTIVAWSVLCTMCPI